jgi:F-type H+-transporting ATPase subunit b
MLIDWFTVGAQTVNFLILVWLLKRFLYQPIQNAIDDRERRIAKQLADADEIKSTATHERDEYHQKNLEFEQQRSELLTNAIDDAAAERRRLFEEARKAADLQLEKRRVALERDQLRLSEQLVQRTWDEVFAIARKSLSDLAGISLEQRMSEVFLDRLSQLTADGRAAIVKAIGPSSAPVVISSAFELQSEQRASFQRTLNQALSVDVPVRFEVLPQLMSGIELTAGGQKLAWCFTDYLTQMETSVRNLSQKPLSSIDQVRKTEPKKDRNTAATVEAQ